MKPIIYPYKMGSKSAIALAKFFNTKRVYPDGYYFPYRSHLIVNWGNSTVPAWKLNMTGGCLNHPNSVAIAASKIKTYRRLEEKNVPTVYWTESVGVVREWLGDDYIVLARAYDNLSQGRGITILDNPEVDIPKARFYSRYQEHNGEYRVHVFNGRVIDFVQKKKMRDERIEERGLTHNKYVRNHQNGWIFARVDVELPDGVEDTCINAVDALGLDFGAVDVIYSEESGPIVLEINTAPGLEGTTLEKYQQAIGELL
jgi:hypothetical protein